MTEDTYDARRVVALRAARDLVAAARAERAAMSPTAPERDFYLGVEAAADMVLRPYATVRDDGSLSHESASFRDGYLKTSDLIAAARTRRDTVFSLPLPEPSARSDRTSGRST
jgi:hypothetical protein